ncbi:ATP-binding protein [Pseudoroseicyclus aestuarii]|uniref:histidine kinase n=1 Tax=Pseudoroseicyclus aestuarii TaxID=1795041 RepID=A0A318T6C1_9RHOB|nr:ATP-binding protein [Pseudoroseicyclus aestuarii]PYE85974.1 signal transduction histidine kinase [Pseudoroseicyclus aestuarii]
MLVDNIVTMVESASVMLLPVLVLAAIRTRLAGYRVVRSLTLGAIFMLVGVFVVEHAVEIRPGIRIDPRAAVVAVATAFGGPFASVMTGTAIAFLRWLHGGSGALPGVGYVLITTLVSLGLWVWWHRVKRRDITLTYVFLFALVAGLVPPLSLLYLSSAPWSIYWAAMGLAAPTNFLAALLLGYGLLREQERVAAIEFREEKQAQINGIADHAPVVLFQVVRRGGEEPFISYISRRAETMFGMDRAVLGQPRLCSRQILGEEGGEQFYQTLRDCLHEGDSITFEIERPLADGTTQWLRTDAGMRIDRTGARVWDGMIFDVTERRQIEQMKDSFISIVSHELRTPLTSIRGSLGLVVGMGEDAVPPKIGNMIRIANRNAERLVTLVNDLLDMQKIQAGQMTLSTEVQPVGPILDQAVLAIEGYAPDKLLRIAREAGAPEAMIDVDADRLHQVLMNLLSNAAKFSPQGGTIHLRTRLVENRLRITVADEGPGIPPEFRAHLFDRFKQADTRRTRKLGGTGLGLNISRAITETLQGRVWFDETSEGGATFHLELPLAAPLQAPEPVPEIAAARLLICGSSAGLNARVIEILSVNGAKCDLCPDLSKLPERIAARTYSALVIDLSRMSDLRKLEALRPQIEASGLPLVLVAADPPLDMTDLSDWLPAPVNAAVLRGEIDLALRNRQRSTPRVLYVEDDASLHQIIRENLDERVDLVSAASLSGARRALAQNGFDLVILDKVLPDGSGLDLLDEIDESIPVIVFSAFEVGADIGQRVYAVMTKSRVRECDVAREVTAALAARGATGMSSAA